MRCVGADDVPQRMDLFVRRPALLLLVNRYFRVKRSTTWCAELRFWRDHDLQNGPRDVCFQAEAKCAATADMVKGFGCRQAYESLSCRNPRSAFRELWGFVYR
ncbi:hypothetical protein ABIE33_004034, partial [Ensifer sp. 4252]